ncbi:MAG: DUF2953 domain-containing protein [Bacteroidales bacterium]|nr:DUF2953 domain-containing protein [Clostridium sp.]MCM1203144.1 DUF2953 domain-containing protein [Bacteroidales bacterium]
MILSVLKVIGIVVIVLLLLIIFILCELLFIPVRYRFSGRYDGRLDAEAQVTWLPVLLKVQASVKENKLRYEIKLFGGIVMTNTGKKLSWLGRKFFASNEDYPEADKEEKGNSTVNSPMEVLPDDFDEKYPPPDFSGQAEKRENETAEKNKNEKTRAGNKLRKKITAVKAKWKQTVRKCRELLNKKDALTKVYHSKRFSLAKQDVQRYLKELFRIIRPDELEGYIHFGMEDPAATGQILGGLSLIMPLYDEFLLIRPDFEKKCLDGNLSGNGKVYLFKAAKLALKVIFNKNLIKVTKKVQTIIEA